jgi:hypothetical protein
MSRIPVQDIKFARKSMVDKIHIAADSTIVLMVFRYCDTGLCMCVPMASMALRAITSFTVTMSARRVLRIKVHPTKPIKAAVEPTIAMMPVASSAQYNKFNALNKRSAVSPKRDKYMHAGRTNGGSLQLKIIAVRYIL